MVLIKVDQASMYNSVESRAPFLSKRIINFSLNNDTVIKILYLNKSKKDKFKKSIEIKLDVLNESLRKIPLFNLEDTLTYFPKIDWLNKDTFKFEHKNNIYHVNFESELYCVSVAG